MEHRTKMKIMAGIYWGIMVLAFVLSFGAVAMAVCGCTPPISPTPDASDANDMPDVVVTADAAPTPAPVPTATADAAPVPITGCALACANMAKAGCSEGVDVECVKTCTTIQGSPNFTYAFPLACLTKASTKLSVQKCGVPCGTPAAKPPP